MFSKFLEISGIALISIAIGNWARWEAGVLFAGIAIVFVGGVTDDAAVGVVLRRGTAWIRYGWWRQIAKENGVDPTSPQPKLTINPEAQAHSERLARARQERAKLHDRGPALARHEYEEELERLG